MLNLLIIDSQPTMGVGIKLLISASFPGWNAYWFKTVEEFSSSKLQIVPEMIVLGIDMENENSDITQVSRIRKKFHSSSLVICGEHLGYRKVVSLFKSGICGYISRKSSEKEFVQCFKTVGIGNRHFDVEPFRAIQ